jgi:hypothetical protein
MGGTADCDFQYFTGTNNLIFGLGNAEAVDPEILPRIACLKTYENVSAYCAHRF